MRKLKRMLLAVFLLFNSAVLYSQTTISGVVTSSADNKPIRFTAQSVTFGDNSIINLQVSASHKQLGELVVTAYGMTRAKRELAYQTKKTNNEFNFLLQKVKCLL